MKLLVQGPGLRDIRIVEVPEAAVAADIVAAAKEQGLQTVGDAYVWLEGKEDPVGDGSIAEQGVGERSRLQVHTCKRVIVTVNFGQAHPAKEFSPATTVEHVKQWAIKEPGIDMAPADAADHVLQVCGTTDRPDVDVHVGSLTRDESCDVCFDLVARERIEGRQLAWI